VSGSGGSASGSGGSAGSGGRSGGAGGAPMPSAGCGRANPPASGRFSIDVSGTMREYILKVPAGYDPSRPYRLILAWHGFMYSANWVSNGDPPQTGPYFGIESQAAGAAIFVAPQALETGWSNQNGRDVAFADAMIARFQDELCVDRSRIFSTGFSIGATMTITLGCTRSDVFRAIAPMSGTLQMGCAAGGRPVAYWASNGDADSTVTPATGRTVRNEFATRNGCRADIAPTDRAGCEANQGCPAGYPVTFCVFSGAHVPPPFAGEAIWSFLQPF
jgi:poly(3-hydroxybutyrate) depolymerase